MILPATDRAGAMGVAEEVRQAVLALRVPHAASPLGVVSISLGVATFEPSEAEESTALVQRADLELYQAKHQGRNRVSG